LSQESPGNDSRQALIALGDEEAALPMAVTATRSSSVTRHEEFCLREGRHVGEVEVTPRAPESPLGRIVRRHA
jgi:hypothetical protein